MKVTIEVVGRYIAIIDKKVFTMELSDGTTLRDLIRELEKRYGLKLELGTESAIFIKGIPMEFKGGLNAKLNDLDRVLIVPAAFGG